MFSSKSNLRLHVACRGRDWLYELLFVIRMRMYNTYKREGNNYVHMGTSFSVRSTRGLNHEITK